MFEENDGQSYSEQDYMRSLYLKFREDVDAGRPNDYYEINELLDIYDYAQDEGDVMVQMFVFLAAARQHPETREFDERMAFFMSYVSPTSVEDMLARAGRKDSPLWEVLRMGQNCYPDKDPEPSLKQILEKYDSLDCETGLKIVDLLRDMDRRDLLAKYSDRILALSEDPNGLGFEIAETLKESELYLESSRKIAEELTRMEPFNVEVWLLLARVEFSLEHPDEALAAVDYALAIDPEHRNARLTRAVILVVKDENRDEAIDLLNDFIKEDPSNVIALEGLAEAYSRAGQKKNACDVYKAIIATGVSNTDPLLSAVQLDEDNADEYFDFYYRYGSTDEEDWCRQASVLSGKGKYGLSARMMDFFFKHHGFRNHPTMLLYALYDARDFHRFIDVFLELSTTNSPSGEPWNKPGFFSATDYLLLAASYLRAGMHHEASQIAEAIGQRKETPTSIDETMHWRGVTLTAKLIQSLAAMGPDEEGNRPDYSDFDPMTGGTFV